MDYREQLAEAHKLFEEVKAVLENPDATAEEKANVEQKHTEAKRLKSEGLQLKEIAMSAAELAVEMEQAATEAKAKADVEAKAEAERETKSSWTSKGQSNSPGEFKEWSNFLQCVWRAQHTDPTLRYHDPRLTRLKELTVPGQPQEGKQMVEDIGASGGFLVPTEFLAQLQAVLGEESIVRPRATIIRMRRRQIDIPVLDQTGTTSGRPHWFGGMIAYWEEEAALKDITTAEFRKIALVAHKLIMYTRSSNELLDDSAISLADFLTGPMGFSGCINWNEDYAFLQGTGAGQPLGVIPAGATITVPRAAQLAIGFADLANMMESFLPSGRGVWIITQSAMADLIQMSGPAGNASYIWQPNARDGVPGSILGFPVIWSEKVPVIGTAGDVVLADWKYYLVGDREATTIDTTEYDYWRYDQTSWRAVHRVDGQPWLSQELTYADGATTVSPFVILGDKTTG